MLYVPAAAVAGKTKVVVTDVGRPDTKSTPRTALLPIKAGALLLYQKTTMVPFAVRPGLRLACTVIVCPACAGLGLTELGPGGGGLLLDGSWAIAPRSMGSLCALP